MVKSRRRRARSALVLMLTAGLLAGCAISPASLPPEPAAKGRLAQADVFVRSYPGLASCEANQVLYDSSSWPKGDDLNTVRAIDARVRRSFRYRQDRGLDVWEPQVQHVIEGRGRWQGDCDDLSTTVVALARCAGVSEDRLGFMFTKPAPGAEIDHMIGYFIDADGHLHSLGDTAGAPRPLLATRHHPAFWSPLFDGRGWREIKGRSALAGSGP